MSRKLEALALLESLGQTKSYRLSKISTREGRPAGTIGMPTEAVGQLTIMKSAFEPGAFQVRIGYVVGLGWLTTSMIQGCGKTEDGVVLVETLNSIYRLEAV